MKNKIVVAVARELAGFVWAIAREVTARQPALPQADLNVPPLDRKEAQPPNTHQRCRIGNATQPRPQGNPRQALLAATSSDDRRP